MPPKKPKPLSRRSSKSEGGRRAKPETPPKPSKTGVIPSSRHSSKSDGGYPDYDAQFRPEDAIVEEGPDVLQPSRLHYRDDARGLWLYHGDCLEVMDTLLAKHPGGVFDLIFADPPYFLSNGGITCHAGKTAISCYRSTL